MHQCTLCPKSFYRRVGLVIHTQRIHHKNPKEEMPVEANGKATSLAVVITCDLCGATHNKRGEPFTQATVGKHKAIHFDGVSHAKSPKAVKRVNRKYNEKAPSKPGLVVAFCPCCGLDMRMVQAALEIGRAL